jgi:Leucine-rich repeat (LRR) protein
MLQNETQQSKVKSDWPEILRVFETKRYELTLIGSDVSKRIENDDNQLPDILFKVRHLNFLEIAKTSLENLSDKVKGLENLSSLMLHTNKLKSIPVELGSLKHLSHLDLSNNQITALPSQLQNLSELKVINLSGNLLAELFPLENLSKLAVLNISRNRFALLPVDIGCEKLENLSQIDASFNQLVDLANVDIIQLPSLKQLNLENNLLEKIPANLCKCERLKEILLKNNKLQDNRLRKLVDQDKLKAVIEYLERIYVEESKKKPSRESIESNKKGRKSESTAETAVDYSLINILHFNTNTAEFPAKEVVYADSVASIRPYIVCCIVRNLDFKTPDNLKKFLALQVRHGFNNIHMHETEKKCVSSMSMNCKHTQLLNIKSLDFEYLST